MGRGELRTIALEMEASHGERRAQNHCTVDGRLLKGRVNNNVEIIECKLELFKNPKIDFINQEISAERLLAIVSAP
jgi:hypothetical protein